MYDYGIPCNQFPSINSSLWRFQSYFHIHQYSLTVLPTMAADTKSGGLQGRKEGPKPATRSFSPSLYSIWAVPNVPNIQWWHSLQPIITDDSKSLKMSDLLLFTQLSTYFIQREYIQKHQLMVSIWTCQASLPLLNQTLSYSMMPQQIPLSEWICFCLTTSTK